MRRPLPLFTQVKGYSLPVAFFLALVAGEAMRQSLALARSGIDPWYAADWLINYAAGFVRRGLSGTLLLAASHVLAVPPVWVVFGVTASLYSFFVFQAFRASRGVNWNTPLYLLVFSPATFSFEWLNFGIGFRKEILLFAILAWLTTSSFVRADNLRALSVVLAVLLPAALLSHEIVVLYMPYIFAILVLRLGMPAAIRTASLPGVLVLAGCAAVLSHPGGHAAAASICHSIGGTLKPLGIFDGQPCSGSIAWLQANTKEAHQITEHYAVESRYFLTYGLEAFLTVLPFPFAFLKLRRAGRSTEAAVIAVCAAAAMLASLPAFYTSLDWGRWIRIHAVCTTLLLLYSFRREDRTVSTSNVGVSGWTIVGLYASTWSLRAVSLTTNIWTFGFLTFYSQRLVRVFHFAHGLTRRLP